MSRDPDWLTTEEAARLAKVRSLQTVRNWLQQEDAPSHTYTPGGHLRIEREPFERWLERQRQERARRRRGA